jgi:hypothetical protein
MSFEHIWLTWQGIEKHEAVQQLWTSNALRFFFPLRYCMGVLAQTWLPSLEPRFLGLTICFFGLATLWGPNKLGKMTPFPSHESPSFG